jgi:hypothetical protein
MSQRMNLYVDSINDCGLNRLFIFAAKFVNLCTRLTAEPFIIQFKLGLSLHHLIVGPARLSLRGYLQLYLSRTLYRFALFIYNNIF